MSVCDTIAARYYQYLGAGIATAITGSRPAGSTRTIFAAMGMFAFARVGGRALPLGAKLAGMWRTNGGRIASVWPPCDSIWNRRDGSWVLGFILKSAGTQAGPADTLPGLRV